MSTTKRVALTFDDGPNPPYTNQILDILKKENIKATFFVCGANVKRHPEIVKLIAQNGHLIGNHSYNHRRIPTMIGAIYQEIIETQRLIETLTGQKQKLFRSPWLAAPPWIKNRLKSENFRICDKGIVGKDWEGKITVGQIVKKILSQAKNGSIIVLHDGYNATEGTDRSKTVKALPQIIDKLKEKDFTFVPIQEL